MPNINGLTKKDFKSFEDLVTKANKKQLPMLNTKIMDEMVFRAALTLPTASRGDI